MLTFDQLAQIASDTLEHCHAECSREQRAIVIGGGVRAAMTAYEQEPTNGSQLEALETALYAKLAELGIEVHHEPVSGN